MLLGLMNYIFHAIKRLLAYIFYVIVKLLNGLVWVLAEGILTIHSILERIEQGLNAVADRDQ
eukprot:gene8977-9909_t